jgi:phospholipid transport system substrate-binding protein
LNRRGALRALGALPGAVAAPAFGANDEASIVTAPVRTFYDALLDAMRRAKALGVHGRYDALAPVIRATFDLAAMTRISVGPRWNSIPPEQQTALIDGFTRMTIATYASRFDGYSGERFEVDPAVETRKTGSVVHTRLVQSNGEPIAINYLMRRSAAGWKVVDVYLTGAISELATRRSEFSAILDAGGPTKLIDTLKQQTDQLLQPTPAK